MYSVFKSILIISCLFLLFICLFECVGEWMNWVGYNKKFLFALWNHHGVGIHNWVKIFMKSHSNLCQNWYRQVRNLLDQTKNIFSTLNWIYPKQSKTVQGKSKYWKYFFRNNSNNPDPLVYVFFHYLFWSYCLIWVDDTVVTSEKKSSTKGPKSWKS